MTATMLPARRPTGSTADRLAWIECSARLARVSGAASRVAHGLDLNDRERNAVTDLRDDMLAIAANLATEPTPEHAHLLHVLRRVCEATGADDHTAAFKVLAASLDQVVTSARRNDGDVGAAVQVAALCGRASRVALAPVARPGETHPAR